MKPNSSSRYDDATEKMLRRQEWKRDQERQRQHERLKQRKIYEYEIQRAREKGLKPPKPPNRSKSRSKSPRSRPRRPCSSSSTNTPILSDRLESADGTGALFKGTRGTKVSVAELHRIKVDIHRNIPGKSTDSDLQRDIINPEDVVVKRRAGEGLKPIFEREEIKGVITKTDEVEDPLTVVTVNNDTSEGKLKTFKKRSMSLSPIRNRSHSPRHTLSRHFRNERSYRNCRDRRERDRSKEQRVSTPHYIEHIPVPIYYSHFPPRPIMMTPFMPIRGQVPLGNNRYSPMMGPLQPDFSPRFIYPDVHRLRTPFHRGRYRSNNF
ncbi:uncharacterized protein LOC143210083 [Lasioglossum baleicum]|uniref:uncharacterized protein LOC143210083 n=1 Tax=Lasioglossum baleicum TaxID=434251 RepID=UPI003FCD7020